MGHFGRIRFCSDASSMLIMGTAGGLWIVSGAMFWKRSWWIAVIFLLVGYAVGVFAGMQIW